MTGALRSHKAPPAPGRVLARTPWRDESDSDAVSLRPPGARDEARILRDFTAWEPVPDAPGCARDPEAIARDMDDLSGIVEP